MRYKEFNFPKYIKDKCLLPNKQPRYKRYLTLLHAVGQTCQVCILLEDFISTNLFIFLFFFSQRDFLSLELVDGKVRLTVDLGSGPLALTTENRYNNGTWYKISFSRNKKQGRLQAEKTGVCTHTNVPRRGTSLQPNLDTSNAEILQQPSLYYFAKIRQQKYNANLILNLTHLIKSRRCRSCQKTYQQSLNNERFLSKPVYQGTYFLMGIFSVNRTTEFWGLCLGCNSL